MSFPAPPPAAIERECNSFVTDLGNRHSIRLTPTEFGFLKKAYYFNKVERRYFCHADYPNLKKVYYRQIIHRLKPIIIRDFRSNPGLYRIDGIEVSQKVTMRGRRVRREVPPDFLKILLSCKQQPVEMHNIRISTFSSDLHGKLACNNLSTNEQNDQITLQYHLGDYIHSVLNIFRTGTIQIIIGCSQKPILYALTGFNRLIFHLGRLREKLELETIRPFLLPPVDDWIIDLIHFNQDGKVIDTKIFNFTLSDLSEHSVFYIKHFDDGTVKPRFEKHETPHKTIAELQRESYDKKESEENDSYEVE